VDPILSTGVDLAMEGAFKAAIAINTLLDEPELTEQALCWYEKEYKTKAGHFLQMAEHWYHGHRKRDDWFWKAKQLVEPGSNLSIRQAFILLTGGFTTGAGDQDLPALQSFGGFRPFQLRTIYENLEGDSAERATEAPASTNGHSSHAPEKTLMENAMEGCPRFKTDMSYRLSMLEQDNRLVPVVHVTQDIAGVSLTRLVLPTASLPVLEKIDGERSVQDITSEITRQTGDGHNGVADGKALSVMQELHKHSIIELVEEPV